MQVKKKIGRPTKLTPDLQEKICGYISKGNYIRTACMACGVTETSYYSWLDLAEQGSNGIHAVFLEAVKKAEAEAEATLVQMVQETAPKNWLAAMTMLERRWPGGWSRIDRIQSEHKVSGEIKVIHKIPAPDPVPMIEEVKLIEGSNDAIQRHGDQEEARQGLHFEEERDDK